MRDDDGVCAHLFRGFLLDWVFLLIRRASFGILTPRPRNRFVADLSSQHQTRPRSAQHGQEGLVRSWHTVVVALRAISTMSLDVSMYVWSKCRFAAFACLSVGYPTKPKRRDIPSLVMTFASVTWPNVYGKRTKLNTCAQPNT